MYATIKAGVRGAQRALSFPFSRRMDSDDVIDQDIHYVARALRRYREKQKEEESVIVESALPFDSSYEHIIRNLVGAEASTPVYYRMNSALLSRVQIYYNGNVFVTPPFNSIDRLKSLLRN